MKILDRYLLKRFIVTLLAGLCIFVFIFIIVDMTDNLSSLIDSGRSVKDIIFIYISQIPSLIMLLYPVGSLVALFFTVGVMVRNNEFTAIKAMGISAYRFLMPLFIMILILSSILIMFNEYIVVNANRMNRELRERKNYKLTYSRNLNLIQNKNDIITAAMYSVSDSTLNNIRYMHFNDENALQTEIHADKLFWTGNNWMAKKAYKTDYTQMLIKKTELINSVISEIKIKPGDILIDRENTDIYRIGTIKHSMEAIKRSGYNYRKQMTEIYYRFSYLFITLIIIMIGSAFVIALKTKGIIFGLAMSILISFIYWGVLQGFRASGENGNIAPFIAILIPNILFASLAFFLLLKARK